MPVSPAEFHYRHWTSAGNRESEYGRDKIVNSQGTIQTYCVVLDIVIPIAEGALDDPGRFLDKARKVWSSKDGLSLVA